MKAHLCLEAVRADIATLNVDVIVNAANNSLLGGGGVDGAIHRAAGPDLLRECQGLGGCKTGAAVMTDGYLLPAKMLIHTVGPVWSGGGRNEAALLASCYEQSLRLALAHDCRSIAFPAISCGVYGYPAAQAAKIAVSTIRDFLNAEPDSVDRVLLVAYSEEMYRILAQAVEDYSADC